ncbi:hypothetical protein Trydic_g10128 [Trypoxylus dichotomus]
MLHTSIRPSITCHVRSDLTKEPRHTSQALAARIAARWPPLRSRRGRRRRQTYPERKPNDKLPRVYAMMLDKDGDA